MYLDSFVTPLLSTARGFIVCCVFISVTISVNAQTTERRTELTQAESAPGFKKQNNTAERKVINEATSRGDENNNTVSNTQTESRPLPVFNYSDLPSDVQQRLNENKNSDRYLFDGVVKGYTVNIPASTNPFESEKLLSFLSTQHGFIKSEFVSPGTVRLLVQPDFDSVQLKELLKAQSLDFNFVNEFFTLDK